jgi:hypothetical protein
MAERSHESEGNTQEPGQAVKKVVAKRVYEKPAFRFERTFVTSALTCGKIDSTEFLCRHNRKVS